MTHASQPRHLHNQGTNTASVWQHGTYGLMAHVAVEHGPYERKAFQKSPHALTYATRPVGGTNRKLNMLTVGQKTEPVTKAGGSDVRSLAAHCLPRGADSEAGGWGVVGALAVATCLHGRAAARLRQTQWRLAVADHDRITAVTPPLRSHSHPTPGPPAPGCEPLQQPHIGEEGGGVDGEQGDLAQQALQQRLR